MKIPSRKFCPRWLSLLLAGAAIYGFGSSSNVVAQGNVPAGESQTPQATLDAAAKSAGLPTSNDNDGRHLAPRGTFYLLRYVSAKTPSGVIGFEPGRKVQFVEAHPASQTLVVGDDEAQVEVGPGLLTNDLDVAAAARQKDEANQAKVAAYIQAEQTAHDKFVREAAEATAKDIADRKEEQKERVAAVQEVAQARDDSQAALSVSAPNSGNIGGYYDDGGFGYGSPYAYFVNNAASGTPHSAPPAGAAAKPLPGNVAAPAKPAAPPPGRAK